MRRMLFPVLLLGFLSVVPAQVGDARQPKDEKKKNTSYRPAAEEIQQFKLPPGFTIELVADEPAIINPVCLALDDAGRMYVSESHTYRYGPKGSPVAKATNPIVRLDRAPDGKGFQRVVVAEGFDDPVMGMVIRDGKLWAAANNFLYRFDLTDEGPTKNKQVLLTDKNKAWNPFGMFVLEWGPDGLLYLSVGNHNINIVNEKESITGRGSSGIVMRMRPDGSKLERLVHGLRVPYSFEYDPFGQLWLLSNGEGNPNRFVRVIQGVDYHCYSRSAANNEWLAGNHPLAPPCFALPSGACTQLVRYHSAAYPAEFRGSLFLDNWGAHGFGGANRTIFRYAPDERNQVAQKDAWLTCADPHFRCSHVILDHDGNFLIADWYGRDDESDLTGRIWRVKYTGADKPTVANLDAIDWRDENAVVQLLASPHHRHRERAQQACVKRGAAVVPKLAEFAAESKEPLGAATALWTLLQIGTPETHKAIAQGTRNADWRVRRLALLIAREYNLDHLDELGRSLAQDNDPAVRLEAARCRKEPTDVRAGLLSALAHGAAKDAHLRYEAAWHLARVADAAALDRLLSDALPEMQLAGLIALDVACYEKFETQTLAGETLARYLANPGMVERNHLFQIAKMNPQVKLNDALVKLAERDDLPAEATAQVILMLRSLNDPRTLKLGAQVGKRFLTAVEAGSVKITTPTESLLLLELLNAEPATPFALKQIEPRLLEKNNEVRLAAHALARRHGPQAQALATALWPRVSDGKGIPKLEERLDLLATVQAIEAKPNGDAWKKLLTEGELPLVVDAVRSWRSFADSKEMTDLLTSQSAGLLQRYPTLKEDLQTVRRALKLEPAGKEAPDAEQRTFALAQPLAEPAAALGRRVFERAGCVKCHTTVTENTTLAPSLKGIGKAQKIDYLIESVLEPSKVIKTGFETETIATTDGKVFSGLVKEEGANLRIIQPDTKEVVLPKAMVEERTKQKKSLMPDGLARELSVREFADLMAYLQGLK